MVVPSIRVITFQDLIRSVVVYFNTGTFPREGKWFLGADIEAAPCLFCSKQSWAIKWEDVAWTCFGFVVTELSTFWLVCPVALHLSVCSRCTCLACFLLLFFPSRGCFSYCSVQFLSHVLSFLRSFFSFTISTWLLCILLWLWILVALLCIHLCPLNACGFVIVWVSSVRL